MSEYEVIEKIVEHFQNKARQCREYAGEEHTYSSAYYAHRRDAQLFENIAEEILKGLWR